MERFYGILEVPNVLGSPSVWNSFFDPMAKRFILWKRPGKPITDLSALWSNRCSVSHWQRGSDTVFNGKRCAEKKEAFAKKGRTSFRNCNIQDSSNPSHLNYRRVFLDKVFVGHEISGHSYEAYVVEIGNELGSYEIGIARRIRAHLTYLDKKNEVLHRICPARWRTQEDEISIRQGESDFLVVAWNKGVWTSDLFGSGIQMPEYSKIEVRLIDLEGKDLLAEPLVFEFRAARYGNSSCVKL